MSRWDQNYEVYIYGINMTHYCEVYMYVWVNICFLVYLQYQYDTHLWGI